MQDTYEIMAHDLQNVFEMVIGVVRQGPSSVFDKNMTSFIALPMLRRLLTFMSGTVPPG